MFQYCNENTSQSDNLFELISSQKWRKLKVYISKNKNIVEAYHAQCTGTSILNVNKCLYHSNSIHNALLYACYFHPPLEVVKCLYDAYPKAIQDLQTALSRNECDAQVLYKLGLTYFAFGKYKKCVKIMKEAIQNKPFLTYDSDIYYHIGLSYCRL